MSPIVAGRFDSIASAEDAARILFARGFSVWDVSIMSVRPQGEVQAGTQAETHTDNSAGNVMLAAWAKRKPRKCATDPAAGDAYIAL